MPDDERAVRWCLRCSGPMHLVSSVELVCRRCGWQLAYDPRTHLVRPAGYSDADLARLRDILRDGEP